MCRRIREGDVVRSRTEPESVGVVVAVMDSSAEQDGSGWELHVDTAADGVRYGIEIWEPDSCVVVDDPGIRARLEAIGVRGPLA